VAAGDPAGLRRTEPGGATTPAPDAALRPLDVPLGPGASRLQAAAALLALGARASGLAELGELARHGPVRPVAAPLAELAAFAGDADLPFRMARDQLGSTRRTIRWLHPEPLPSLLEARAAEVAVDPDLVRAVLRRESAFRADARSGAGAIGLMQLVAPTAERLVAIAGVAEDPTPRLAEPELNVGLGAHYLALLVDRFGDEAVALAAYNAGPRAAASWARERSGLPLDEWIEAIPYKETRVYVKTVLAAREVYRRLGGSAPTLDPARRIPPPAEGAAF
jgi:soluble lytic murein transglycosylase